MMNALVRFVPIVAVAAFCAGLLSAQDVTGSWHGTLETPQGQQLRMVFEISQADGQGLRAVIHSIDQPAPPINAGSVTAEGANLKIGIPAIGGNYDGKLSEDGNSIEGKLSQATITMDLKLVRETPETAWVIPEPPAPPKPMAADAVPEL